MATLDIKDITKNYGALTVIKDLSLHIKEGEFCVLVGPSGCGKSTLLRIIAGLETITNGTIEINGVDVKEKGPAERHIAMVFQSYALYPHMNVKKNMAFGLEIAKLEKLDIKNRVAQAAKKLKLKDYLLRKPRELSGGQRQRVAIGRAITRKPTLFLLDEPLSNLDAALRVGMRAEIARIKNELSSTMIYVTHDQVEALTLADRIVVMDKGNIMQIGTPLELYHKPDNLFVASFIGSPAMNFLPSSLIKHTTTQVMLKLSNNTQLELPLISSVPPAEHLTLGIRPEHLCVVKSDADSDIIGVASLVEMLGSETFIHVDALDQIFVVRDFNAGKFELGEKVRLKIRRDAAHIFGQDGSRISNQEQLG